MAAAPKNPTSAEVARRAGVSRTTVSFVLNGVAHQGISEATRERVLAVARELHYTPHAAARTLAGGRSGTVGVLIPKVRHLYVDVFLAQLVASVNDECRRQGLRLLVESCGPGEASRDVLGLVRSRRIDGLIAMVSDPADQEHLLHTAADGVPSVVIGLDLPGLESLCAVGSESVVAAFRLVEHLTALGHRRIGFIDYEPASAHRTSEREQGWRQALDKVGITPEPAWLVRADITAESGYAAARELLARGQDLSALFAGNDTIAFGALRAVHEAGLRVPEDLSLVGYDDIPLAAFAHPPLTTVRTDPIAHGREAMQMLGALMRKAPVANRRAVIGTALVVRGSCGPVPRRTD